MFRHGCRGGRSAQGRRPPPSRSARLRPGSSRIRRSTVAWTWISLPRPIEAPWKIAAAVAMNTSSSSVAPVRTDQAIVSDRTGMLRLARITAFSITIALRPIRMVPPASPISRAPCRTRTPGPIVTSTQTVASRPHPGRGVDGGALARMFDQHRVVLTCHSAAEISRALTRAASSVSSRYWKSAPVAPIVFNSKARLRGGARTSTRNHNWLIRRFLKRRWWT